MKHFTLFGAMLALCSAPAFAQAPDSTSRPAQTPDSSSQSDPATSSANTTGKKATLTGCISERNGKYILMTNNESSANSSTDPSTSQSSQSGSQPGQSSAQSNDPSGSQSTRPHAIELISTQDLKQHVGHTVRVTGTMSNSTTNTNNSTTNSSSDANSATTQDSATSTNTNRVHRTMTVTDMQMVSETCNTNNSTTTPPQPH